MFRKPITHFIKIALITFSFFGMVLHALAQSPPLNVPNPPPEKNEQRTALEDVVIHVNQVAYDETVPKFAVLETSARMPASSRFLIRNALTSSDEFEGTLAGDQQCEEWFPGRYFYRADFSSLQRPGRYKLLVNQDGEQYRSFEFEI